ncbi:GSCFA domain-containing protein [Tenacibaculum sp. SZ-18]|uniref:GSCFA domain-containing protein n=1 Tax=Tenacibaculum sp. SZ-18 TaxID=754423 RepID=UPI000C2D4B38|nr:GSCFA domain-containing protein [Tenacibaculum sp. SZ-18]AUC13767.1 GSCFA domain-containing protein [Tenacibaculum sp. SZ-18]
MNLQTQIPLQKEVHRQIDYSSKLFLLGSCFSENIGNKLSYYKFQSTQNPLGILFHPKAIEQLVVNSMNDKEYTEEDIFELNERWHCFDAHSQLSNNVKEELLHNLNEAIKTTNEQLTNSTHIIITLGTAWVYRHISSDKMVANCHKVPQKQFLKELLSVDEVTESLESITALIRSINPKVSIIFTVSPVRHVKDGFVQNQQSKSHLIAGIHNVIEPRKNIHYFPSYEIMMDELRDYRFYKEDMIHPNQTAIHYIWEKFVYSWFNEFSLSTMKRVEEIQKGITHKPFNPNSEAHQKFLEKLKFKQEKLQKEFSFISF